MKEENQKESLENHLTVAQLKELRTLFFKITGETEGGLTLNNFKEAISHILSDKFENEAILWFNRIIAKTKKMKISWKSFIEDLENIFEFKSFSEIFNEEFNWKKFESVKNEHLVSILTIHSQPFTYLMFNKMGTVGVYDSFLICEKLYNIDIQRRNYDQRWSAKGTVTDVILMENCTFYVLATTNRCLHFVDISASLHLESYVLTDLPYIPTCLYYCYNIEDEESISYLFWGDLEGSAHCLQFLDPTNYMFNISQKESTQWISLKNIEEHKNYILYKRIAKYHKEPLHHLHYIQIIDRLITCSSESEYSMVVQSVFIKNNPYIMKLRKGVQCFDYCERSLTIATGSKDALIRIWNPCVLTTPESIFRGHQTRIACLRYHQNFLFSLSTDMHFFIWDINDMCLVQQLKIKCQIQNTASINKNSIQCQTSDNHSILIIYNDSFGQLQMINYKMDEEEMNIKEEEQEDIQKKLIFRYLKEEKSDDWMSYCISKGCPYLSLELHEISKLEIKSNLPKTDRMKRLSFKCKSADDLLILRDLIY